ncbi:hypothetical protein WOLCODRAFT_135165 [Wolfiporia cocos MD-104 SS10]|uniref:Uncharacterized protein n=1 Tax=Wolfiporia cocos (strain MD-104) TaxID=742152 RepID=A0A2H3JC25_WOLCO|nr:hypothetical protein WOLCODRAFT_135165 [Wolfiporia cocos MD-104 SS10]
MPLAIPLIPEISISLASPEEPVPEPFSPFSPGFGAQKCAPADGDDNWRATLLSPPPVLSPRNLSPLRPTDSPIKGQGLERERFEALLRASRERNVALGSKKALDLRKEIAIKAHKSKQVERRALFLSKVQAPPSPTATLTPKTPPESPAIFHYSLPSPGLDSPIAVFESLSQGKSSAPAREPWVEQVDFRFPGHPARTPPLRSAPVVTRRQPLPSLDQITARLSSHVAAPGQTLSRTSARLPAFLQSGRRSPPQETDLPTPKVRPPLPTAVGRLHFPSRPAPAQEAEQKLPIHEPKPCLPPASPTLAQSPKLQVTTTVVPRTSTMSPTEFTESNLLAHQSYSGSREDTARMMLTRLRRRTLPPVAAVSEAGVPFPTVQDGEQERKMRRRSAPPELQGRERTGFSHPILALPGAF